MTMASIAQRPEGTRRILRYLTEDCCRGNPDLCGELVATRDLCT